MHWTAGQNQILGYNYTIISNTYHQSDLNNYNSNNYYMYLLMQSIAHDCWLPAQYTGVNMIVIYIRSTVSTSWDKLDLLLIKQYIYSGSVHILCMHRWTVYSTCTMELLWHEGHPAWIQGTSNSVTDTACCPNYKEMCTKLPFSYRHLPIKDRHGTAGSQGCLLSSRLRGIHYYVMYLVRYAAWHIYIYHI